MAGTLVAFAVLGMKNPWRGVVEGWRKGKALLARQKCLSVRRGQLTFRGIPVRVPKA